MERAVDHDNIPESTEQALGPCLTIPGSTEHTGVENLASLNDEDTSSVRGESVDTVRIDVFDSDQFMVGLRTKNLFDSIPDDDVNLVDAANLSDSESGADDDNILEDNQWPPGTTEAGHLTGRPINFAQLLSLVGLPTMKSTATNRYRDQNIPTIALSRRNKLLERQVRDPRVSVPNLEDIIADLNKFKKVEPHEFVYVIGLLIARAIAPIRDGLANH
ncbi:hypothetical protein PInf_004876 [Phytophthora infestans]|nr:hypothetical protein PInf_004876 [Phytophthora infestans]